MITIQPPPAPEEFYNPCMLQNPGIRKRIAKDCKRDRHKKSRDNKHQQKNHPGDNWNRGNGNNHRQERKDVNKRQLPENIGKRSQQ